MDLGYKITQDANDVIMALNGELDVFTAPEAKDKMIDILKKGNINLVLDLTEVEFVDSTGLGVFISAFKHANTTGSRLALKNPSDRIKKLLDLTGISKIITVIY